LAWLALLIAAAVRYSFNIYDIHGRLLYPALAPIGVVLVLGLSGWPRPRWVLGGALAITLALAVLAPFAIIRPAYARPLVSTLPDGAITTSTQFDGVELIGYQLKTDRVKRGEPIEVMTFWRKTTASAVSPSGIIALLTPSGQTAGRSEVLLGTAAYPAEAWQSGDIVATRFVVPTQTERPTVATARLQVGDQTADLSRVTVWADRACDTDRAVDVAFGDVIKLIGYRIQESTVIGVPPRIVLCWQALNPMAQDYTVFVHVPAPTGMVSGDAQPLGGNYPTSAWLPGDIIEDAYPLPAVAGWKIPRASIGLYRLDTGERLPIDGTNATEYELTR
jgi:hypothetical protein